MSIDKIVQIMAESERCRIGVIEENGNVWRGIVDMYEEVHDNQNDGCTVATIYVRRDDGSNVLVSANDIQSIAIIGEQKMRVRYLGDSDPLYFLHGKVYEVLSIEYGYYRIIDETDEDYLYDPDAFEVVEYGEVPTIDDNDEEE